MGLNSNRQRTKLKWSFPHSWQVLSLLGYYKEDAAEAATAFSEEIDPIGKCKSVSVYQIKLSRGLKQKAQSLDFD